MSKKLQDTSYLANFKQFLFSEHISGKTKLPLLKWAHYNTVRASLGRAAHLDTWSCFTPDHQALSQPKQLRRNGTNTKPSSFLLLPRLREITQRHSHIIRADGQFCVYSEITPASHRITLAPAIMCLNEMYVYRHLNLLFDIFTKMLAGLMHALQRPIF